MKLIIDIDEYAFERIKEYYDALPEDSTVDAKVCYIANGTPIPDNATTVDDVLDKIRAEIADLDDAEYEFEGYYKAVNDALQIIDKYK